MANDFDSRQDDITLQITHTCEIVVTKGEIDTFRRENPGITAGGDMHFNHNIAQLIALSKARAMINAIDPRVLRNIQIINRGLFEPNLTSPTSMLDQMRQLTQTLERFTNGR